MSAAEAEAEAEARLLHGAAGKDQVEDDGRKLQSEDADLIAWITSCEDTPFVPNSKGGGILQKAAKERMPFRWGAGTLELVVQQIPLLAGKTSSPPSPPPSQASSQSTTNAEIVVPPGVLLTWQLDYEGEGLGKILCLPLDSGVFTRDELAGCLQSTLQSTVRHEHGLEWSVLWPETAETCGISFTLSNVERQGKPSKKVTGFRIQLSEALSSVINIPFDEEGWLVAKHTHSSPGEGDRISTVEAPALPLSPYPRSSTDSAQPAQEQQQQQQQNGSVGKRLLWSASDVLQGIGGLRDAALNAHHRNLLAFPNASFGVSIMVVSRREGARYGWPMRTPLALEGLFDHIEALVGASEVSDVVGRPWKDWLSPSDEISLQVKKLSWVMDERPDYTLPLLSKFDQLATMLALLRKYMTMMPEPLLLPSSLDSLSSVAKGVREGLIDDASGSVREAAKKACRGLLGAVAIRLLKLMGRLLRSGGGEPHEGNSRDDDDFIRAWCLCLLRPSEYTSSCMLDLPSIYLSVSVLVQYADCLVCGEDEATAPAVSPGAKGDAVQIASRLRP